MPVKTAIQHVHAFFSGIWKGILGIYIEILFTLILMIIGFLVCLFWWGVSQ